MLFMLPVALLIGVQFAAAVAPVLTIVCIVGWVIYRLVRGSNSNRK
jgi:hypothetical protein